MGRQFAQPIVVAVLAALLGYTWAQGPTVRGADDDKKDPSFPVAVVDFAKVMNGYKRLTERKDEIVRELEASQEKAKTLLAEAKRLQEEAKRHKEGSPDHQRISDELKSKAKAFDNFRREQQQAALEKHSKIMLWGYERVIEQIQQYADAHHIKLVMHSSPIPGDEKTPQEIYTGISNRKVLYQNALDITEEILQALN